jgi:predicted ribosomally synthesized peptide with SipW-like signal peptide
MKRLLLSVLLIGVVSIGAIAATRAFFTDTETVLGNTVSTGKVDIQVSANGNSNPETRKFTINNLMPGKNSDSQTLAITNVGPFPVKYKVNISGITNTTLYNNILVSYSVPGLINKTDIPLGSLNQLTNTQWNTLWESTTLANGATHTFTFTVKLDPNAGNDLMGKTLNFNINVTAIQQEGAF